MPGSLAHALAALTFGAVAWLAAPAGAPDLPPAGAEHAAPAQPPGAADRAAQAEGSGTAEGAAPAQRPGGAERAAPAEPRSGTAEGAAPAQRPGGAESAAPASGASAEATPDASPPEAPGALPPPAPSPSAALPAAAAPAVSPALSPAAPAGPHRGLWVLSEGSQRVLEHADRLPLLLDDAKALGATDLFVQVYRGGRAWFDSTLADARPGRPPGAPPSAARRPARAAARARARRGPARPRLGERALALARIADAPLLRDLGRDAVLVDQRGRSLLDYPGYDVPPPDAQLLPDGDARALPRPRGARRRRAPRRHLRGAAARYPGLDGLHLDYIRFPDVLPFSPGSRFGVGLDFGYGAATRARFEAETGLAAPFARAARRTPTLGTPGAASSVSALVGRIAARARAARPGVAALGRRLSLRRPRLPVACSRTGAAGSRRGTSTSRCRWPTRTDERLLRYQVDRARRPARGRAHLDRASAAGSSSASPARAVAQTRLVEARAPLGVALFSWDSIREMPALREALVAAVARASPSAVARTCSAVAPAAAAAPPPAAGTGARRERARPTSTTRCRRSGSRRSPPSPRDAARLLVLERASGARHHAARARSAGAAARPATCSCATPRACCRRACAGRKASGGAAEALLLERAGAPGRFRALAARRAAGSARARSSASRGRGLALDAEIAALDGGRRASCSLRGGRLALRARRGAAAALHPRASAAQRRTPSATRRCIAREPGAVAAPTAGLHFTAGAARARSPRAASRCAEVVLHVGPGTFRPLARARTSRAGRLHAERFELPEATARRDRARRARAGGRVVAVGTTTRARARARAPRAAARVAPGRRRDRAVPARRARASARSTRCSRTSTCRARRCCCSSRPSPAASACSPPTPRRSRAGYRFYSYGDAMLIALSEARGEGFSFQRRRARRRRAQRAPRDAARRRRDAGLHARRHLRRGARRRRPTSSRAARRARSCSRTPITCTSGPGEDVVARARRAARLHAAGAGPGSPTAAATRSSRSPSASRSTRTASTFASPARRPPPRCSRPRAPSRSRRRSAPTSRWCSTSACRARARRRARARGARRRDAIERTLRWAERCRARPPARRPGALRHRAGRRRPGAAPRERARRPRRSASTATPTAASASARRRGARASSSPPRTRSFRAEAPRYLMGLGRPRICSPRRARRRPLRLRAADPPRRATAVLFTARRAARASGTRASARTRAARPRLRLPHLRGAFAAPTCATCFACGELLGARLATLHNLRFYLRLLERGARARSPRAASPRFRDARSPRRRLARRRQPRSQGLAAEWLKPRAARADRQPAAWRPPGGAAPMQHATLARSRRDSDRRRIAGRGGVRRRVGASARSSRAQLAARLRRGLRRHRRRGSRRPSPRCVWRAIAEPVQRALEAIERVAAGDFDVRVAPAGARAASPPSPTR